MVERHVMIVDQDLLVFFDRCAFYALAPFVFAEEIKMLIMVPAHKYMRVLPVHTACSRVHMHGWGKQEHGVYALPFFFGLLGGKILGRIPAKLVYVRNKANGFCTFSYIFV